MSGIKQTTPLAKQQLNKTPVNNNGNNNALSSFPGAIGQMNLFHLSSSPALGMRGTPPITSVKQSGM